MRCSVERCSKVGIYRVGADAFCRTHRREAHHANAATYNNYSLGRATTHDPDFEDREQRERDQNRVR